MRTVANGEAAGEVVLSVIWLDEASSARPVWNMLLIFRKWRSGQLHQAPDSHPPGQSSLLQSSMKINEVKSFICLISLSWRDGKSFFYTVCKHNRGAFIVFLHLLIVSKPQVFLATERKVLVVESVLIQPRWSQTNSSGGEVNWACFRLDKSVCCPVMYISYLRVKSLFYLHLTACMQVGACVLWSFVSSVVLVFRNDEWCKTNVNNSMHAYAPNT